MARPSGGRSRKKGKKNRQFGRNKPFCKLYREMGTQEKNRKRRILRHLKRFPEDIQARRALAK